MQSNHFNGAYFKDPYKFRPERWESECEGLPSFVVSGFGFGSRSCIGKNLALLESKIGLIKFFKRYNKIKLLKEDYRMVFNVIYESEAFDSQMQIGE